MNNKDQIIADFNDHLQKSKKEYWQDFYVGITNDMERRLFLEHNVKRDGAWWIYRKATDKATAQAVEEHFLDKGMKGDTGGGNEDSTFVYCYEISSTTVQ